MTTKSTFKPLICPYSKIDIDLANRSAEGNKPDYHTARPGDTRILHAATGETPAITRTVYKHERSPSMEYVYKSALCVFSPSKSQVKLDTTTHDIVANDYECCTHSDTLDKPWKQLVLRGAEAPWKCLAVPASDLVHEIGGDEGGEEALVRLKEDLERHFQRLKGEFEEKTGREWVQLKAWKGEEWEWESEEEGDFDWE
ncbi:hypothetical protein NX059_005384 [Plenodomus lindquistii]|nr:hypothetical protein NX059_005384 [Plenodomus lindquistii]